MVVKCRAASVVSLVCVLALVVTASARAAELGASGLRIDNRADQPLGVDDTAPVFSWRLTGTGPGAVQTAYQVRATNPDGATLLWDSGKVASSVAQATYAGAPLTSRLRVAWQVRVWDATGEASDWSASSSFEMGLLDQGDWGAAKWINLPGAPANAAVTLDLGPQDARYVRLDVTKLGLPVNEGGSVGLASRLQLAELELVDSSAGGVNRAQGAAVSASNPYEAGGWSRAALVDGVLTTPGYTSLDSRTQDVNPSHWVQLDLGAVRHFDKLQLYPRTDLRTADGRIPNFPVNFTLQVSAADPNTRTTALAVTDQPTPAGPDTQTALPIFARAFTADKPVARARLYLTGLGQYVATLNGRAVTDTVLTPGNSNAQRSLDYGAYDVTGLVRAGANTVGVELGNGITNVFSATNPSVGRTSVYQKFASVAAPAGTLAAAADAGASTVKVSSVAGYSAGATLNVDTGNAGAALESRTITAVGSAGAGGTGITLDRPLDRAHASGAQLSGSGAATQPGIAVSPRMIARLEVTYEDGTTGTVVSDPGWRAARGPTVTDNWYAGSDYDARRVQPGWDEPGADLTATGTRRNGSATGWVAAGLAPAPNLATKLIWREAPPVKIVDELTPQKVTHPNASTWVFDMGQNQAGFPELHIDGSVPAGTVIRMQPAELLAANGTVNAGSTGSTAIYDTYTTSGNPAGETWRPQFVYHGYQYIQVTGLPSSYVATSDTVTALQTHAENAQAGTVSTSDSLVNSIHRMSQYSIMSNMQSVFTDCPHREKLGWLADVLQSIGTISRNYDVASQLRLMVRHMAESQQTDGLVPDIAPEMTVFGGGFRDDANWGDAIILTPLILYKTYGDTRTMREYYPQMKGYMGWLAGHASGGGILNAALADWAAGDTSTPADATGTYAYYNSAKAMAQMATALGEIADAASYTALADSIAAAFNARFFNPSTHSYTTAGPGGTTGSQAMDAFPLEMGIVPAGEEQNVLADLIARIRGYHPNGGGPHISGGMVSLQAIYRTLTKYGRDDFLWEVFKEPTRPSYGYFVSQGRTTIPEFWDLASSQNHMILLQIDEWFSTALAGIRQADDSTGFERLVIRPRIVGDLTHVQGSYATPRGTVRSEWTKDAQGVHLKVTVPPSTTAKVYVPAAADENFVGLGGVATPAGREDGYQVFDVGPGEVSFLRGTSAPGDVGGTVPPTLSLTLGAPASFGAFAPGVARDYSASTTANVISTAGDATLTVADPGPTATGHLVNGTFALPSPLRAGGAPLPATMKTYSAPVSNDAVTIGFTQHIGATDALRTGSYSKTLTFTLSTTTP